ncbi:substrate-binding domain-containing protein [Xanthobacter versatilis]|uniref:substrate-binding domain-containing protein n=1 Tax=Xanthobacter autotrophicus (strain ATCC BAA-1158 / Py2) TaxID=78245 RepID=UPI00372BD453
MRYECRGLLAGISGLILSGLATSAFAEAPAKPTPPALRAATVCTVVPSSATYDATIAVASNFYGPAQDLLTSFTSSGKPGAGYHFRVCHNATGDLDAEIRTGTSGYSLFLAADTATPHDLVGTPYVQSGATDFLYANGIPVLFARYATVSDVQTLMPSVSSGVSATLSAKMTGATALSTTNSQTIAVANLDSAPYGEAAYYIMRDMGLWSATHPENIPSSVSNPLYDNIALTFQSVANSPYTNKSGFVSKAQICSGISSSPPTYIYIAFTYNGTVSPPTDAYLRKQSGILIASGNSTQNSWGVAIKNYMLSNSDPTYWPTFLNTHCYAPI